MKWTGIESILFTCYKFKSLCDKVDKFIVVVWISQHVLIRRHLCICTYNLWMLPSALCQTRFIIREEDIFTHVLCVCIYTFVLYTTGITANILLLNFHSIRTKLNVIIFQYLLALFFIFFRTVFDYLHYPQVTAYFVHLW